MAVAIAPEEPQESRRIDYATCVFVSADRRHQTRLFDKLIDYADLVSPFGYFKEMGHSAHFDRVWTHHLGMRIELTQHGSDTGRNPGMTVLTLPGAVFYASTKEQWLSLLWQITQTSGFKWFSRLDLQNTELEPDWDTDRVVKAVQGQRLWVPGYRGWKQEGMLDSRGECPGGRTLYWGSPRSERQARTYDKGKQLKWTTPAIRDEIQLRGEWAHAVGRELKTALNTNLGSDDMAKAVSKLVTGSLNQHLQYWELDGADPKTDKNWKRNAQPADWFAERIGKHQARVKKNQRVKLDLGPAVSYGVQQYGRCFALDCLLKQKQSQLPLEGVVNGLWERFLARLSDEDLRLVYGDLGAEEMQQVRERLSELKDAVAYEQERGETAYEIPE